LEEQACRRLKKDQTESAEHKTVLLLKKSSFSKVCQQRWLQGSRPSRLYRLLNIYKQGIPLRLTVITAW
jgi:hypothetical protein